jgi:hypothetical protein
MPSRVRNTCAIEKWAIRVPLQQLRRALYT